jgi:TM2 domain-containing membrane protein YozV
MNQANATHSALVGYIIWIFGFLGAHRFYLPAGAWSLHGLTTE